VRQVVQQSRIVEYEGLFNLKQPGIVFF